MIYISIGDNAYGFPGSLSSLLKSAKQLLELRYCPVISKFFHTVFCILFKLNMGIYLNTCASAIIVRIPKRA